RIFQGNLNATDPPRHMRLRNLISRAFTPRSVAELRPFVERAVHHLIDLVIERGACELNADFSGALPLLVIGEMLGIPALERETFRELCVGVERAFVSASSGRPVDPRSQERLNEYFRAVVAERRARPRADLTSRLLEAEIDGERLMEEEVLAFLR